MTTKSNTMLIIIAEIIILILLLFGVFISSNAQTKQTTTIDTVVCKVSCIQKIVEISNTNGKVKTFAVYIDKDNNIDELIPVSSSVLDYVKLCNQNSITPTLGIRLRNGQISSIIRYRQKFRIYEKR